MLGATLSFSPLFLVVSVIRIQFRTLVRGQCGTAPPVHVPAFVPLLGPNRRCEIAPSAANAPKTCRSQARRARLHVSHLGGQVPNPIAPESGFESQRPDRLVGLRRSAASSFFTPSRAASAACSRATTWSRASAFSTLAKPVTTARLGRRWPAHRAPIVRASRPVRSSRSGGSRTSRLNPRAKTLRLIASPSDVPRCRHPDAAARQLALEVGHRLAVGSDHEPDQIRNRPHLARRDAQAFDLARARPAIELDFVRLAVMP